MAPRLEERTVRARLMVEVVTSAGEVVGEFTVRAEAAAWTDKENVQGLVADATSRLGKKARAMAAGVDNNEAARLK